jgi:uncharacterized ubiquitin-like protein YukD
MNENINNDACRRLRKVILVLSDELGMDTEKIKKDVESMNKDELMKSFCKLRDLRITKENNRIIDIILEG